MRRGGIIAVAALVCAACFMAAATGPRDLSVYPPAAESPYRLPWPEGVQHLCVQGNNGIVSHKEWEEFAYDFSMPEGSPVCAARAGTVIRVVLEHDGHGYKWPNNLIAIQHDDGTIASYLHLKKDGGKVKAGDTVAQGQVIAESGHVGNSMLPHLHFHVTDADRKHTLPVTFVDVTEDEGIPRMMKTYTSGNAPPAPETGPEPSNP